MPVTVQGVDVFVKESGAGEPVLLVHGNPDSADIWDDVVPRLQHRFRCVAIDLPGFGRSQAPRGTGNLGFYETPDQVVPIRSAAVAADLPPEQRTLVEILRTDSPAFQDYLMARRTRVEEWFVHKAGRIDVCNVGVPARILTPEE